MSRFIRTAGGGGGLASALNGGDGSGLCCLRTEWETLFQCEGGNCTSFGCCIEFTVDATKYRGFRLHMNGFCASNCMNCQVFFGVGSSDCYCCCLYTSWWRCTDAAGLTYQCGCNNKLFGGSSVTEFWCYGSRVETEIISSAACSRNWRGYQRIFHGNTSCFNTMIATGNYICGTIWCDITRLKYYILGDQNILSMPGAYLAVFGLKAPTCSIAFNATLTDMS